MNRCLRIMAIAALLFLVHPSVAFAGMPMTTLTDLAPACDSDHLLLPSAFPRVFVGRPADLERGSGKTSPGFRTSRFRRAIGLVALWGLLFLLVLTMISGARELMTPGAWKKEGFTYKLKDEADPAKLTAIEREPEHEPHLTAFAPPSGPMPGTTTGIFPPATRQPKSPTTPGEFPTHPACDISTPLGTWPIRAIGRSHYEPGIFGTDRLVLLTRRQDRRRMTESELSSVTRKAP